MLLKVKSISLHNRKVSIFDSHRSRVSRIQKVVLIKHEGLRLGIYEAAIKFYNCRFGHGKACSSLHANEALILNFLTQSEISVLNLQGSLILVYKHSFELGLLNHSILEKDILGLGANQS